MISCVSMHRKFGKRGNTNGTAIFRALWLQFVEILHTCPVSSDFKLREFSSVREIQQDVYFDCHYCVFIVDQEGVVCGCLGEGERGRREEGVRWEDGRRNIIRHWQLHPKS